MGVVSTISGRARMAPPRDMLVSAREHELCTQLSSRVDHVASCRVLIPDLMGPCKLCTHRVLANDTEHGC
jgi:hypothetical protein